MSLGDIEFHDCNTNEKKTTLFYILLVARLKKKETGYKYGSENECHLRSREL